MLLKIKKNDQSSSLPLNTTCDLNQQKRNRACHSMLFELSHANLTR